MYLYQTLLILLPNIQNLYIPAAQTIVYCQLTAIKVQPPYLAKFMLLFKFSNLVGESFQMCAAWLYNQYSNSNTCPLTVFSVTEQNTASNYTRCTY